MARRTMRDEQDGGLGDDAAAGRLEAHLRGCERCATRRTDTDTAVSRLRAVLRQTPRIDVVARVMARIYQAVPGLRRAEPITERQFAASVAAATVIAAAAAAGVLLLAPGALTDSPAWQLAYWIPKAIAAVGILAFEAVQFVVLALADVLRALSRIENRMEFLGPLRVALLTVLAAAVLATTAVAVRRDLNRSRAGAGWNGGTS